MRLPRWTGPALTGRSDAHIVEVGEPHCRLHQATAAPFLKLRAAAARAGIDLIPASSFRDFATQERIWNAKWRGERPLLDRHGRTLEAAALTPAARLRAILCWSALPGASRHHWGSDFDVIDAAALPAGYRVQLVPAEYAAGGVFAQLGRWLDENLSRFEFYRPYRRDRGGVSPEPWHLSHAPVARAALAAYRVGTLQAAIAESALLGKEEVLLRLPTLYRRYVRAVDPPPRRPVRLSSRRASGVRASARARSARGSSPR